ncbi:hypothetical protein Tco_0850258 [Tanacetum coccineum]
MAAHTERMEIFENSIFKQREEINDRMEEIGEEERNNDKDVATGDEIEKPTGTKTRMPVKEAEMENETKNGIKNEPIRKARKEETTAAPSS